MIMKVLSVVLFNRSEPPRNLQKGGLRNESQDLSPSENKDDTRSARLEQVSVVCHVEKAPRSPERTAYVAINSLH